MTNVMTLTSPLMRRSVGFDRFNDLFESLFTEKSDSFENYPPYNIEKLSDDDYRITMAVAGFSLDDLDIVHHDGTLTISGRIHASTDREDGQEAVMLHRGIATRAFEKSFRLADYIRVEEASLKDGLLSVSLHREVPEEKKPRMIPINSSIKAIEAQEAETVKSSKKK